MEEEESEQTQFPSTAMFVRESAANSRAIPTSFLYLSGTCKGELSKSDLVVSHLPHGYGFGSFSGGGGRHTRGNLTPIMMIPVSHLRSWKI